MTKYIMLLFVITTLSCSNITNNNITVQVKTTPTKSFTLWTEKTELFVEFPALIVNKPSRFAAHFTILKGHKPVSNGSVTVSLIKGSKGIRNKVLSPSSPGIFSPTIVPKEAGNYQLIFDLKSKDYEDQLIVHDIIVYPNENAAIKALGAPAETGGISFLKEQAWKMDFQTESVSKGKIYEVVNTSGVWQPLTQSSKTLVSGSNGMVNFNVKNLTEGVMVKRGQLLLSINSKGLSTNNLSTKIIQAKTNLEQAKSNFDRKKELYDSKIVSKAVFEKAENAYLIAKSSLESLSTNVFGDQKQIRAPFDGFIRSLTVSNGNYVNQGETLLEIATQNSKVLKAQLSASYGLDKNNIHDLWYQTRKGDWKSVKKDKGSILSITKNVANNTPLISVFAEVNNTGKAPLGSFVEVQIGINQSNEAIIIPESALLESYGSYSVMAQVSGETFEKRVVTIGKRNGDKVEINSGLKVGDVIVTIGAYQVKMASMSGTAPAHGHAH